MPEYPYAVEKDIELSVNDEMSDIDMDGISVMDESEDYDISLNAEVCEQISAEDTMDATVGDAGEANIVEEYVGDRSDDKGSYEAYKKMTLLEKAQTYGFGELKSYDTVRSIVQMKFWTWGILQMLMKLWKRRICFIRACVNWLSKTKQKRYWMRLNSGG